MSDQGFDFRKSPERRESKQFIVPPWEQDAFEELQRKKQEEGSAEDLTEAIAELAEPTDAVVPLDAVAPQVAAQVVRVDAGKGGAAKTGPSEAEVVELLANLAAAEPSVEKEMGLIRLVTALMLGPVGMVLLIWGMAGFVKASAAGPGLFAVKLAAGTMIVFGAGFIVGATWLVYRYLRQRGVV